MPDVLQDAPQLLLATNNLGKVAELRTLLADCGWQLVTPDDLGSALPDEETGQTYAENAADKALRGAELSGLITLADDSGLEVQAMDGEPGVHSARFLSPDASYAERFAEIQRRLAGLPRERRLARFVCVIVVADPHTRDVRLAEGEIRGLIADKPRGTGGFGYDPIFWVFEQSATMAELPQHQKDIISHRARAAAIARQALKELLHEYAKEDPGFAPVGR